MQHGTELLPMIECLHACYFSFYVYVLNNYYTDVVSKPVVFSMRVGGYGFTREKIRLGTSYRFSWHRGMPSLVTLGSSHMDYSHFCITRIELEKWPSQCRCAS